MPHDIGKKLQQISASGQFVMFNAKMFGRRACNTRFVIIRFLESNGECLNLLSETPDQAREQRV